MKRTCSNCCSFDAPNTCTNGLMEPIDPGDRCEHHETQAEFDADVRAIARFRQRLGLPPQRPWHGLEDDEGGGVLA